uniref:SFRICE_034062 n=1 Tax=Spodoptera frugiperda TaxID=7108 RepID=A0A2H1W089_SPOFR
MPTAHGDPKHQRRYKRVASLLGKQSENPNLVRIHYSARTKSRAVAALSARVLEGIAVFYGMTPYHPNSIFHNFKQELSHYSKARKHKLNSSRLKCTDKQIAAHDP